MMERVRDYWDSQRAGCLHDLRHRPDALVVLQREVAQDAGLGANRLEKADGACGSVFLGTTHVQHDHRVWAIDEVEDAGCVAQLYEAAL